LVTGLIALFITVTSTYIGARNNTSRIVDNETWLNVLKCAPLDCSVLRIYEIPWNVMVLFRTAIQLRYRYVKMQQFVECDQRSTTHSENTK